MIRVYCTVILPLQANNFNSAFMVFKQSIEVILTLVVASIFNSAFMVF